MPLQVGHQSPARWRVDNDWIGSFVIFKGSGSKLLGNPKFMRFSWGGGPDPLSPLWIRPWQTG